MTVSPTDFQPALQYLPSCDEIGFGFEELPRLNRGGPLKGTDPAVVLCLEAVSW